MLDKLKKMMSKKETQNSEDLKVFNEQIKAREEAEASADNIDEVPEPADQYADDPNLEVQMNQDSDGDGFDDDDDYDDDDDFISDEEWEKMTPEERAEIEAEEAEYDDDDDDYISDEEWEKMTPEQRKAWEEEDDYDDEDDLGDGDATPIPETVVTDDDDPDYIKTSPEVVGFDDREQQIDMYDVACEDIEPEDSILDFGCGRGDLYDFLYRRDGVEPNYTGVDINEQLVNAGLEKYAPNINIEHKDWNLVESTSRADWCVNIGSLCTRYDGSAKEDIELVKETIDKMMNLCTVGSVLILFSSYMPDQVKEEEFLITDPREVFDYAIKKYGRDNGNVIIDHSYSDSAYKITILRQQ